MIKQNLIYFLILFSMSCPTIINAQLNTNKKFLLEYAERRRIEQNRKDFAIEQYLINNKEKLAHEIKDGVIYAIDDIVNGKPVYLKSLGLDQAITIKADELWPSGGLGLNLSGDDYNQLAMWDIGRPYAHIEYASRLINGDTIVHSESNHSTAVAGIMIAQGIDPLSIGMVYESNLVVYDSYHWTIEVPIAAANGLKISSHTFGSSENSAYISGLDTVAYNAPFYSIVHAAGNSDHIHNTIINEAVSKNVISVGAINKVTNYSSPGDVQITSTSSWGPTDDGRIKPDIVSQSAGAYTTINTNDYSVGGGGTSWAAPGIAGMLVLLNQHYNATHDDSMRAATIKALIINTTEEAGPADGPDYTYGWGLPNTERAANIITYDTTNNVIDESILYDGNGITRNVYSYGLQPLKVTIVWTDSPASDALGDNDPTAKLINDLDLVITNGGTTYYPWKLDPSNPTNAATNTSKNYSDNVEQVHIANPTAGIYEIKISNDGQLSNDGNFTHGFQPFSIVISGGSSMCENGSIIYNTDTGKFNFCENGFWVEGNLTPL